MTSKAPNPPPQQNSPDRVIPWLSKCIFKLKPQRRLAFYLTFLIYLGKTFKETKGKSLFVLPPVGKKLPSVVEVATTRLGKIMLSLPIGQKKSALVGCPSFVP